MGAHAYQCWLNFQARSWLLNHLWQNNIVGVQVYWGCPVTQRPHEHAPREAIIGCPHRISQFRPQLEHGCSGARMRRATSSHNSYKVQLTVTSTKCGAALRRENVWHFNMLQTPLLNVDVPTTYNNFVNFSELRVAARNNPGQHLH